MITIQIYIKYVYITQLFFIKQLTIHKCTQIFPQLLRLEVFKYFLLKHLILYVFVIFHKKIIFYFLLLQCFISNSQSEAKEFCDRPMREQKNYEYSLFYIILYLRSGNNCKQMDSTSKERVFFNRMITIYLCRL